MWQKAEGRRQKAKGRRGQSTLEYVLVVGAVLAAIVAVAVTTIKPAAEQTLTDSGNTVTAASGRLQSGLGLE